jgi:hypothetical protein
MALTAEQTAALDDILDKAKKGDGKAKAKLDGLFKTNTEVLREYYQQKKIAKNTILNGHTKESLENLSKRDVNKVLKEAKLRKANLEAFKANSPGLIKQTGRNLLLGGSKVGGITGLASMITSPIANQFEYDENDEKLKAIEEANKFDDKPWWMPASSYTGAGQLLGYGGAAAATLLAPFTGGASAVAIPWLIGLGTTASAADVAMDIAKISAGKKKTGPTGTVPPPGDKDTSSPIIDPNATDNDQSLLKSMMDAGKFTMEDPLSISPEAVSAIQRSLGDTIGRLSLNDAVFKLSPDASKYAGNMANISNELTNTEAKYGKINGLVNAYIAYLNHPTKETGRAVSLLGHSILETSDSAYRLDELNRSTMNDMLDYKTAITKAESKNAGSDGMSMNNINSQINNIRGAIISLEKQEKDEGSLSPDQQTMLDQLIGKLEYLETKATIVEI